MAKATMIIGCPSSGKSSYSSELEDQGFVHLNRDAYGGSVADLLPIMDQLLEAGVNVVLDNTFPTVEGRSHFISVAKKTGADINCIWISTSIEDAQINALFRMYDLVGHICLDAKMCSDAKHPNVFPPAALFKYRKQFEKPTTDEGFSNVTKVKFERDKNPDLVNKAIIFDYDGTLRTIPEGTQFYYPVNPSEVIILPGRTAEIINRYRNNGYHILGVSNQSGIGKGNLTYDQAVACFEKTNELLGVKIEYKFCPHSVPPISCYCRKPQSGLGVALIHEYKLDPKQVIMVGDLTSDKTFASRLGFEYVDANDFFK